MIKVSNLGGFMPFNYKIEAKEKSILQLLKEQKFYIDYFQREYRWTDSHIKTMIDDLSYIFFQNFSNHHQRKEIENYQNYFLGSIILYKNPDTKKQSIIDGQQRLTSLTLLLIYLNHLQNDLDSKTNLTDLIFSEKYGEKSFNLSDDNRINILESLLKNGSYELKDEDDETVKNMLDRYHDIENYFPEEITGKVILYFIDWLINNVILAEITTYSDDAAYTIFETMNDRGLNLNQAEMLKGYILSKLDNLNQKEELNRTWKTMITKLHKIDKNEDIKFFQTWFRSQYARSIQAGKADSLGKDYEDIGTRFHTWFKDHEKDVFSLEKSDDFFKMFKYEMVYYVEQHILLRNQQKKFSKDFPHTYYCVFWGIAESLRDPLMLASVSYNDSPEIVRIKFEKVAHFIEHFSVLKGINYKKFGHSRIRSNIFNLIIKIRNKDTTILGEILKLEIMNLEEKFEALRSFRLHGANKYFVKHLLSRLTNYLDQQVGKESTYEGYHHPKLKPYEIEHIWANKIEYHIDEISSKEDFDYYRNLIGDLILLPNGTNQSYSSDTYASKREHYLKENTLAQSLHEKYYEKNPNFTSSGIADKFKFNAYKEFEKNCILKRTETYKLLCESIWDLSNY